MLRVRANIRENRNFWVREFFLKHSVRTLLPAVLNREIKKAKFNCAMYSTVSVRLNKYLYVCKVNFERVKFG